MGRRWGKTVLGGYTVMQYANQGGRVAWIAPTYKNSRPMWRWAEGTVAHLKAHGVEVHRSERTITFPGGGMVGVYSGDSIDSLRGESFHLAVLDEAARIAEDAWQSAIQPTLADWNGDCILISTPNARNWFYAEWMKGKSDGRYTAAWQASTDANPNPNIKRAFARARLAVPDRTFRQEWLAEFIEGEGAVFRNVRAVCTRLHPDSPDAHAGHSFVMGVDWGKVNDYTRLRVLCRECMAVVDWDGFNKIDYTFQRERLKLLADRWGVSDILAESNSIGEPNIEELRRDNLPVRGFKTTAGTKPPLIEALSLAIQRGDVKLPAEDADELEAYEVRTNANTFASTYSAPDGAHDDRVMADALALWAATGGGTWWIL